MNYDRSDLKQFSEMRQNLLRRKEKDPLSERDKLIDQMMKEIIKLDERSDSATENTVAKLLRKIINSLGNDKPGNDDYTTFKNQMKKFLRANMQRRIRMAATGVELPDTTTAAITEFSNLDLDSANDKDILEVLGQISDTLVGVADANPLKTLVVELMKDVIQERDNTGKITLVNRAANVYKQRNSNDDIKHFEANFKDILNGIIPEGMNLEEYGYLLDDIIANVHGGEGFYTKQQQFGAPPSPQSGNNASIELPDISCYPELSLDEMGTLLPEGRQNYIFGLDRFKEIPQLLSLDVTKNLDGKWCIGEHPASFGVFLDQLNKLITADKVDTFFPDLKDNYLSQGADKNKGIIVPINSGGHWVYLVFQPDSSSPANLNVSYYDSMCTPVGQKFDESSGFQLNKFAHDMSCKLGFETYTFTDQFVIQDMVDATFNYVMNLNNCNQLNPWNNPGLQAKIRAAFNGDEDEFNDFIAECKNRTEPPDHGDREAFLLSLKESIKARFVLQPERTNICGGFMGLLCGSDNQPPTYETVVKRLLNYKGLVFNNIRDAISSFMHNIRYPLRIGDAILQRKKIGNS